MKFDVRYVKGQHWTNEFVTQSYELEFDGDLEQVLEFLCACGLRVADDVIVMPAAILQVRVLSEPQD